MKTPPWVENSTKQEDKNYFLYGDKILFGFPKRTYFELYAGTCSSDKIYSVQTKDFPKDIAAVIYDPKYNLITDASKLADGESVGKDHIFVALTDELVKILAERGITSDVLNEQYAYNGSTYYALNNPKVYEDCAWVNPNAFEWLTQEQVELEDESDGDAPEVLPDVEQEVDPEESTKKKSNKNKAIIAALLAALSLLN